MVIIIVCNVCRPAETTTEFCVIPIEDEVHDVDSVSPEPDDPPRTVNSTNKTDSTRSKVYCIPDSIILPGTPTSEDSRHVTLRLDGEGSPVNNTQSDEEHESGTSPCASTVSSSAGSTKSTDMLLPTVKTE